MNPLGVMEKTAVDAKTGDGRVTAAEPVFVSWKRTTGLESPGFTEPKEYVEDVRASESRRLLPESRIEAEPFPRTAIAAGEFSRMDDAMPTVPVPCVPSVPATVLISPVAFTRRMAWLPVSAM